VATSPRPFSNELDGGTLSQQIPEWEAVMSLINQAMKANEQFAKKYDPKLGGRPQPKIAIVTCMDPRLSDLEELIRVVNEAQERDAEDELRLYHPMCGNRPSSFQRRRPNRR
jgi:hypothetical protein